MKNLIPKDLMPYFKLSLAFHAGIFVTFGMKVLLFPDLSNLDDTPTIKVDLVALPDKGDNKAVPKPLATPKEEKAPEVAKQPDPPKPKPVAKPTEQPKKQDTKSAEEPAKVVEESKADDELLALSRLREMEALKNIEKMQNSKDFNTAGPIKGNRLAPGDSLEGLNRIQYNNYKKVLQDAIKSNWDLPPWLQDGDLSAEALIKIDENGNVTEKELIKSSGNTIYDKYVIETINKSSPFQPPDDKFVNVVAVKGVVLSFN